ncbi:cytochrome P450 [Rhodococcus sp. BE178]|uniref:cytochrome P450 n=1 Tax=Rhodococcus sp. BE178 TaxID=2817737 RepID=UPI003D22F631
MTTETSTVRVDLPGLDDDPFDDATLADPYEFHARLRAAGPVVRLPRYDVLAMGRYTDVHAALTDWRTFVSGRGVGLSDFQHETPWRTPSLLLEADPPDHTSVRAAMNAILSPRSVRQLRDHLQQQADLLVDALVRRGEFDAVTDLAEVFPLQVFPDAVGVRAEGRENLLPYGAMAFNAFGPRNDRVTRALETAEPIQAWISESCERANLSVTGFGAQIWAAADRGEITHAQAPMLVRSLLTAGVDTTVFGIGNALHALAAHPAQWSILHERPNLAKFAFDEALRFESPVQTFFRTTAADTEFAGHRIAEGQKVLLFLGSGNRDERHWGDRSEEFDIQRAASGHVAFGMGIHQCVGQPIARLEAETILTALARRVRRIEPTAAAVPRLNNTLKGWASIPVRVHPV